MVKRIIRSIVVLSVFCLFSLVSIADLPPDPGGGPGGGPGEDPVGGGSPIGGGLIILTSMGIAYGIKKTHTFYQKK